MTDRSRAGAVFGRDGGRGTRGMIQVELLHY